MNRTYHFSSKGVDYNWQYTGIGFHNFIENSKGSKDMYTRLQQNNITTYIIKEDKNAKNRPNDN